MTAAHNVSMKAVALASPSCPAYRLRAADLTTTHLGTLAVYNVSCYVCIMCGLGVTVLQHITCISHVLAVCWLCFY